MSKAQHTINITTRLNPRDVKKIIKGRLFISSSPIPFKNQRQLKDSKCDSLVVINAQVDTIKVEGTK